MRGDERVQDEMFRCLIRLRRDLLAIPSKLNAHIELTRSCQRLAHDCLSDGIERHTVIRLQLEGRRVDRRRVILEGKLPQLAPDRLPSLCPHARESRCRVIGIVQLAEEITQVPRAQPAAHFQRKDSGARPGAAVRTDALSAPGRSATGRTPCTVRVIGTTRSSQERVLAIGCYLRDRWPSSQCLRDQGLGGRPCHW